MLTEKPAGVYTKQVEEMNAAAKKSGKVFGIMYNQRTNPKFQKMREIVQSGELGELKRCIWIITTGTARRHTTTAACGVRRGQAKAAACC